MILAPSVRPSVFLSLRPRFVCPDEYPTPMNIFFRYFTHALIYNPPMNPVKCCQDQIQNGDLSPFLFAQIDKIFENVVGPDEYIQHQ